MRYGMLLFLFLSSFTSANVSDLNTIHSDVLDRFEYVDPTEDEEFQYYDSTDAIIGDCDDFASAAYYELWKRGYEPIIYLIDMRFRPAHHVVTCANGYCFDNNRGRVFPERELRRRGVEIIIAGRLDEDMMAALEQGEITPAQ